MKAPRILTYSVSAMALLTLVACGDDPADKLKGAVEPIANAASSAASDVLPDMAGDDDTLSAVIGASEIPYPVYPNGSKYRCLLYTSPSPRDATLSRMPSSA